MNEIVKYNNQMNEVNFKDFNVIELDLLMTICSKMREQGLKIIEFSFEQLKKISNYDPKQSNKKFIKDLEKTYDKLIKLNFKIGDDVNFTKFVLFNEYTVKGDNGTITIGVNPKFYFVLNELTSNFTRFELKEFIDLKSKYSKECYRKLKQFRKTGMWTVEIEEFRRILDIPEKYRMSEINRIVLKTIETELSPLFKNLQIEKIKKKGAYTGRGNKVTHIVFTFEKEDETPYNVRINGNKTKLSNTERDVWGNFETEENQELDGQLDFTENISNWNK
ncbi:replication protein [Chlamydia trachomatis]|nr:replication protein [Chlamydia trachomatis]